VKHNDYQVSNAHYRLGQSLLKMGLSAEGARELKLAADLKSAAFKRDEARVQAFAAMREQAFRNGARRSHRRSAGPGQTTLALLKKETGLLQ
jgi:hypothetical protein